MAAPYSVSDGTYTAQFAFTANTALINRLTLALGQACEYIVCTLATGGSPPSNITDLAFKARIMASNLSFWSISLIPLLVADGAITDTSTDQQIADQVYLKLFPTISYKSSTLGSSDIPSTTLGSV